MTPAQIIKAHYLATSIEFTPWWTRSKAVDKSNRQRMAATINAAESPHSSTLKYSTEIPAIAEIESLKTSIKAYWEKNTLPYGKDSVRLLRRVDLQDFNKYMEDATQQIQNAAAKVSSARDQIIEDAKPRRGDAFALCDYPLDLAQEYGFLFSYPTLSPSNALPPEIRAQQLKFLDAKINEAAALAQQRFLAAFSEHIQHLRDKLEIGIDGKPKIFRDSAVTNLQEFFTQFTKLKLSEGDDFDKLVEDAKALVGNIAPQDLRDSNALKTEISATLDTIANKLTPLITDTPRHRIIKPARATTPEGELAHAAS